jgi:cytochrome c oxidase subunit IV
MAAEGQQHPLRVYWIMWGALFVLSAFSYATDFINDGALRTFLILLFMLMKAAGIVFIALLVLVWLMVYEADYTFLTRIVFFGEGAPATSVHH